MIEMKLKPQDMKCSQEVYDAMQGVNQLMYSLKHVIGIDDGKAPHEYNDLQILAEADYQLSCYFEAGHLFHEMLNSDDDIESNIAKQEVKQLRVFIRRFKGRV